MLDEATVRADVCVTCGDVAVVGRVVRVAGDTATVDAGGVCEEVGIELVASVATGDFLLCHAGIALARVERRA